jgi:aspartyl protease
MKALAVAALLLWAVASPTYAGSGWLLLFPPSHDADEVIFDASAPLPLWTQKWDWAKSTTSSTYATERLCQVERRDIVAKVQKSLDTYKDDAHDRSVLLFFRASQCISLDDPQLVGFTLNRETGEFLRGGIIRYTPGRPIVAVVRLNGRSSARLILDTGADGSMVKPDLLAAAGVDLSRPAARGKASGIDSTVTVAYFAVDFEVAGHRVRVPQVAAFNTYDDGFADGLLGRDFLDRFKVVMDPAAGTVTLVPRLGAK